MAKAISFPEHMRRIEAGLNVLAAECKKYDSEGRDYQVSCTTEFWHPELRHITINDA